MAQQLPRLPLASRSPWPIARPNLRRFCMPICRLAPSPQDEEAEHYSNLLQRCARSSDLHLGAALHAHLLKRSALRSSLYLQNHLLNMYFKCCRDDTSLPLKALEQMPHRNVVTWSAAIAGLVQSDLPEEALALFRRMHHEGVKPNEFTFVSALNASSFVGGCSRAQQIYAQVIRLGFESNVFLMNAFLMSLIRNGRLEDADEVFEKFPDKDVVSWNSMLAGYLQFSNAEIWGFWCRMHREGVTPDEFSFSSVLTGLAADESLRNGVQVHSQLVKNGHVDDVCVGNSLMDMYLKNRDVASSSRAFGEMHQKDVVSWTQMADGCLHCGHPAEAMRIIDQMKMAGIRPNKFTMVTMFSSCSSLVSLEEGLKSHGFRIKLGNEADECVDNALIDMYSRCGSINSAWRVFGSMKVRSVISYTSIIMGFAQNGLARESLDIFTQMIAENVNPNYITFICVLYACSQGGYLDEGRRCFRSMSQDYNIEPGEDHYACMVDLLGKAGYIKEAEELILDMHLPPSLLLWQTLLGSCNLHGDVDTGKRAAERAFALQKKDSSTYVLLSNMLANTSNWNAVGRVRELMEDADVRKTPGSSWTGTMKGGSTTVLPHLIASF